MIELRTLGGLHLARDGRELRALLAQPKRVALFCFLSVDRAHGFRRRDSLVAAFWPEREESRARAALRQAVHVLRRELGNGAIHARGQEELGIDPVAVYCDAVEFEDHAAHGRFADAMLLCRGPFLDGFFLSGAPQFEDWVEETRARLNRLATRASWELAQRAEAGGDLDLASHWALRAVSFAPDDELMVDRLLTLLCRIGDRAGAAREYERFAHRLHRDYRIAPTRETEAIVRGGHAVPRS